MCTSRSVRNAPPDNRDDSSGYCLVRSVANAERAKLVTSYKGTGVLDSTRHPIGDGDEGNNSMGKPKPQVTDARFIRSYLLRSEKLVSVLMADMGVESVTLPIDLRAEKYRDKRVEVEFDMTARTVKLTLEDK